MATTPTTTKKTTPVAADQSLTQEFAVIATGGKQYRVAVGDVVTIERIKPTEGIELKKGDSVSFDKVLLVDNGLDTTIGEPYIPGAVVTGEIAAISRAQKVTVIKYKQKSRYMKKNGHRQPQVKVKITAIA